jgi:hypothetical protein
MINAYAANPRSSRADQQSTRLAVGLYRVSTAEQGQSGLDLETQQASVRALVTGQRWTLVAGFSDIASDTDDRRPGFQAALARCRQLGAVLVAAKARGAVLGGDRGYRPSNRGLSPVNWPGRRCGGSGAP